jgi:signal transduction histidine kinase
MNTSPTTQLPQARLSQLASTGILKASRDADGKPSYSTEVRLRSKDGEYRWHLVRVLLAERDLQNDEEDTWYGTCTDINDHKALERDLKETMDEKSRFLSNMSHEIRTPLNGITGMVNFLIDSSLSSEQMEHVNIIRASTEGLRGLINDILDLSKAEAGMIQLNMDWMHVRSLIEEVNDLTSAMAIDKGLELNYFVEPNVPSQIKGDRFRIRQILLNVIGNAIKFTQTGEVFVRCSVPLEDEYQPTDDSMYVQFEIMDTGQGFTEKEAQYLFKRFSQIDGSSTRQHGGTGLGLVISRQLAQLHGGDMSARGVPGKGATFAFVIKTSLPAGDDKPPPPPATPGPALLPLTPMLASPVPAITQDARLSNTLNLPLRSPPKLLSDASDVSSPDFDRASPVASSSASSDPSIQGGTVGSGQSVRSSASSYVPDPSLMSMSPPMELAIPTDAKSHLALSDANLASSTIRMVTPGGSHLPPMYSILVVCPLEHARKATVEHMDMTLPKNIPHKITARGNVLECQKMIGGDDPMIFSHIVLVLQSVSEIIAFVQQVFSSPPHSSTQLVLISDLQQRRSLMEQAPQFDHDALSKERKLQFIFKPLKPSKFATIFDPRKEREMSTDRNQDSAQQVAVSQKQVYEEMIRRLGNKNKRVLLVEDNRVNQMVSTANADTIPTWLTACRSF